MGDQNIPLSDAIKVLDNELVKNLFSPAMKEIGDFLGKLANFGSFYMTCNLEKTSRKCGKIRAAGREIESEAFKRVLPLLPLASMVSEDELQKNGQFS